MSFEKDLFETKLERLFNDAIDIPDTLWYSENETLFEAIMRAYKEAHEHSE